MTWYLISYDIRHPRRLQRVHRLLRSQASSLLESLFAFQGSPAQLHQLHLQLARELNPCEDDLLIYPLRADQPLHRWGTACLPQGLYDFSLPTLVEHREQVLIRPFY